MASRNAKILWNAEPHTVAKITILENYLNAWFQILGRSRSHQDLIYVDGFAGPGKYLNYPRGSPIAALTAAKTAIATSGNAWIAKDIHCVFIEPDSERFARLRDHIKPFEGTDRLKVHLYETSFVEGLKAFEANMPSTAIESFPSFVFIDPCGATGVPFDTVEKLLLRKSSEVLLNFDADGVGRIFRAREDANYHELLNDIFKRDTWRSRFSAIMTFDRFCREALLLYKENLQSIRNVDYVFAFEMRTTARKLNYFLVFASRHHLGLEKMKEAMHRVDQTGDYRFSDAAVGQMSLFRFDVPEIYAKSMFQVFTGKRVTYSEVRDHALNHTPFTNPKSMLKYLEAESRIKVVSNNPRRRKGTFKEDAILHIEFK
jgi:three-Cys-motif partner protein